MPLNWETFYNSVSAIMIYKELSASQTKAYKIFLKHSVGGREIRLVYGKLLK